MGHSVKTPAVRELERTAAVMGSVTVLHISVCVTMGGLGTAVRRPIARETRTAQIEVRRSIIFINKNDITFLMNIHSV